MTKTDTKSIDLSRRNVLGLGASSAAAAAAALTMGSPASAAELSGEPFVIGVAAALTGPGAADGIDFMQGFQMAVEDLNAMGGIMGRPVKGVVEDAKEMGSRNNIAATRALIDRHGVKAIFTGYLTNSGAEYEAIADAGIIHLNCNTYETTAKIVRDDPERYWMIFSDSTEAWYGPGLHVYLKSLMDTGQFKPVNRKLAIITTNYAYSALIANNVRDMAEEFGWEVSLFEEVVAPIAEWGPTLSKIRQDPPGLIINTHTAPQDIAQFALQFSRDPTPSLVYMQYGPSTPEFIELAQKSANGILWATLVGTLPSAFGFNFEERYKKVYGENAGFRNAGQTYDLVMLYAKAAAMSGAPDDARAVADILKNHLVHRGVCGSWHFNYPDQCARPYPGSTDDNSLGLTHHFYQIQDGEQVIVGPTPYIAGSFQTPDWMK